MEFRWNAWNIEHIAEHGVTPEEAEAVVQMHEIRIRDTIRTGNGSFVDGGAADACFRSSSC
jgi:hypothetical protein